MIYRPYIWMGYNQDAHVQDFRTLEARHPRKYYYAIYRGSGPDPRRVRDAADKLKTAREIDQQRKIVDFWRHNLYE